MTKINISECGVEVKRNTHFNGAGGTAGSLEIEFVPDRLAYLESFYDRRNGYNALTEEQYDELQLLLDWSEKNTVSLDVMDIWDDYIPCFCEETTGWPVSDDVKQALIDSITASIIRDRLHGNQNAEREVRFLVCDLVDEALEQAKQDNE